MTTSSESKMKLENTERMDNNLPLTQAEPEMYSGGIRKSAIGSYVFMVISCFSWVTGYIYGNQHNLHPFETSILRGFMIMVVSYGLCRYYRIPLEVDPRNQKLLWIRNLVFIIQGFIMPTIQFYLPLSMIHTLGATGSIFVNFFQFLFEKKGLSLSQILGMVLTFVGIIFTANGNIIAKWMDPTYQFQSDFKNYRTEDSLQMALVGLFYVIFNLFWAYSVFSTKKMTCSPYLINFFFGLKLNLVFSFLYPFVLTQGQRASTQVFLWGLLWGGLLFAIAETTFVLSLIMAENIGITIMVSTNTIIFAYFSSIFIYGESLNAYCLLGSFFIVGGLWKTVTSS